MFETNDFEKHTLDIEWNFLDTNEKEILFEDARRTMKLWEYSQYTEDEHKLTDEMIEKLIEEASLIPTDFHSSED